MAGQPANALHAAILLLKFDKGWPTFGGVSEKLRARGLRDVTEDDVKGMLAKLPFKGLVSSEATNSLGVYVKKHDQTKHVQFRKLGGACDTTRWDREKSGRQATVADGQNSEWKLSDKALRDASAFIQQRREAKQREASRKPPRLPASAASSATRSSAPASDAASVAPAPASVVPLSASATAVSSAAHVVSPGMPPDPQGPPEIIRQAIGKRHQNATPPGATKPASRVPRTSSESTPMGHSFSSVASARARTVEDVEAEIATLKLQHAADLARARSEGMHQGIQRAVGSAAPCNSEMKQRAEKAEAALVQLQGQLTRLESLTQNTTQRAVTAERDLRARRTEDDRRLRIIAGLKNFVGVRARHARGGGYQESTRKELNLIYRWACRNCSGGTPFHGFFLRVFLCRDPPSPERTPP